MFDYQLVFGRPLPGFRSVADLRSSTRLQIAPDVNTFTYLRTYLLTYLLTYLRSAFRRLNSELGAQIACSSD